MSMLSRKAEDYLEAIYNIAERKGYAQIKDIASELQITPPSVTEMMGKLAKKGLVHYEKYSAVKLTEKGREIAKTIKTRHDTFTTFLEIILVPNRIAEKDACELEHHLNPKTIEQFSRFVEFVKDAPLYPKWLNHFKEFCETGVHPACKKE
ncbi:MAG: iron-dependent repressor [Theionarchaea archaeon DG-70]|nr:MAG: iron-dependent repressor [Theionarchaea archaeon DG-70]